MREKKPGRGRIVMKILLPFAALVALGFAALSLVRNLPHRESTEAPAQPPSSPFAECVAGVGIVEASSENIAIGSHLSGIVSDVFVQAGAAVRKGDPLFRIDDRALAAEKELRSASLEVAEAEQADADNAFSRASTLVKQKVISQDEYDRRSFAVRTAKARVVQARAALGVIETELERSVVRAPVDGEVLQVDTRPGEFAQAGGKTEPLLLLGGARPFHLRVDIDEQEAWRVRPEANATAMIRGNAAMRVPLKFVRFEPYIVPKRSLTGANTERVDTRVLQVIYSFDPGNLPIFIGHQMDVFIETKGSR